MPDTSEPSTYLTAAEAAEELTRLAHAFGDAFSRIGAPCPGLPDAVRVARARAAALLGAHAVALADLVPESVLLAPARAAGGATPLALPDRPTEIVAVLDRSLGALAARATSTADGALVRVAARLRADLALLAADVDEMQCGG